MPTRRWHRNWIWRADLRLSVILRACEAFSSRGGLERVGDCSSRQMAVLGLSLSMSSCLCHAEAVALQDVVGEGVPEHDGADLFDAAHGQLPQVPVAPAGMDALAYRTGLVAGLARFARHSRAPGQHPRAVAAPRQVRVGAMFGLSGRT